MATNGIDILKDEKGNADLQKTITTFRNSTVGASDAVHKMQQTYEAQLAIERQERIALESRLREQGINAQVEKVISLFNPVDPDAAIRLMRDDYRIEEEEGQIMIYDKNGSIAYGPDARPLTLKTAAEKFFKDRPYMQSARQRDGVGEQPRKGAPDRRSDAELSQAYYSEKDPVKKEALREEMMKRHTTVTH